MGIVKAMSPTKTSIGKINSKGGFFYFLCDSRGENAALLAFDTGKDAEGKKTFRDGRKMIKDFTAEYGKPKYSQGKIDIEGSFSLVIMKGNAKPSQMKQAFKKSKILLEGIGPKAIALLKSAKITMDGGTKKSEDKSTSNQKQETLTEFSQRQDIQDLALSKQEIEALFEAEEQFRTYAESLPNQEEESSDLQALQAETEAILDELSEGQAKIEELLKQGDEEKAQALHVELNEKRIEMARKNSTGPDPFQKSELDGADKEALNAALFAGIELLIERVQTIKTEIANSEDIASERIAELDADLLAIRVQLQNITPR